MQRIRQVQKTIRGVKEDSPRSELDRILKGHDVPNRVKRQLLLSNIVVKEIQKKMKKRSSERKKQLISKIVCGKLIRQRKRKNRS